MKAAEVGTEGEKKKSPSLNESSITMGQFQLDTIILGEDIIIDNGSYSIK